MNGIEGNFFFVNSLSKVKNKNYLKFYYVK